jgi:hypothetical protein
MSMHRKLDSGGARDVLLPLENETRKIMLESEKCCTSKTRHTYIIGNQIGNASSTVCGGQYMYKDESVIKV